MTKFKDLIEVSKVKIKDLQKIIKKDGQVMIITQDDIVVAIDDIDGDMGYGLDQFDNDVEINLKKDKFRLD